MQNLIDLVDRTLEAHRPAQIEDHVEYSRRVRSGELAPGVSTTDLDRYLIHRGSGCDGY